MLFNALYESALRGELVLVDGGMCRYRLRRDGQLTISEILVTEPRRGIGNAILERLKRVPGAKSILAKCPSHLAANAWYARMGFERLGDEPTRTGKQVTVWRLSLS